MNVPNDSSSDLSAIKSSALLALIEAANNLNSIVEGIPSVRWGYDGRRLKDSKEWCAFYCALSSVNDETARKAMMANDPDQRPANNPSD